MNEYVWMIGMSLSLLITALTWIRMKNFQGRNSYLLTENNRLWKQNQELVERVIKLRGIIREKSNATVHGDRVSEN